jgi:phosphate transport system substrate-binding protein
MQTNLLASFTALSLSLLLGAQAPVGASGQPQDHKPAQDAAAKIPLAAYTRVSGITGNLDSIGSDTLNNLMTLWSEGFKKMYPNVKMQVEGKGSGTAPPAITEGKAQLGPMSRPMKKTEEEAFEKKHGFKPTGIKVAVDGLAVYVHKDCPLTELSLEQVDSVFSATRKGGGTDVTTWGQLGVTGAWADKPISLYGRNSASGTYVYFKEHALFGGDFKPSVKEQPGSASVVRSVGEDPYAMGFSGIGARTSEVKTLRLAKKKGEPTYSTEEADVLSGKYPLSRFLLVYVNKTPNKALSPNVREFLRFVLSAEGQAIVEKDGYLGLPPKVVASELRRVGEGEN